MSCPKDSSQELPLKFLHSFVLCPFLEKIRLDVMVLCRFMVLHHFIRPNFGDSPVVLGPNRPGERTRDVCFTRGLTL